MENINEQFKRLFCELDLTDDQAAMIKKLQRDVNAALRQPLVISSVCDCGKPIDSRYAPCCSLKCWDKKFI